MSLFPHFQTRFPFPFYFTLRHPLPSQGSTCIFSWPQPNCGEATAGSRKGRAGGLCLLQTNNSELEFKTAATISVTDTSTTNSAHVWAMFGTIIYHLYHLFTVRSGGIRMFEGQGQRNKCGTTVQNVKIHFTLGGASPRIIHHRGHPTGHFCWGLSISASTQLQFT